eukprot:5495706-Pleurochrysis_carterae.AAC.2
MSLPSEASKVKREKACGVARCAPSKSRWPALLLCFTYSPVTYFSTQKCSTRPLRLSSMTKACRKSTCFGGCSALYSFE